MSNKFHKRNYEHVFNNGTVLTLKATATGLRIYWQESEAEEKHPAVKVSWSRITRMHRNRPKPKTPTVTE
jgi:hypothetical protein